jgi:hypothetical protein
MCLDMEKIITNIVSIYEIKLKEMTQNLLKFDRISVKHVPLSIL